MLDGFKDLWQGLTDKQPSFDHSARQSSRAPAEPAQRTYSADQPITSRDQDRFNRWPFAKRIADTIANGRHPSSLVVGLYGAWGDGKTSTLELMQQALAEHPEVILLRFNPWQFASESQLLRGFFDSVADALGRSIPTRKEDIEAILRKYGSILSTATVGAGQTLNVMLGRGVLDLRESLSSVELHQLRLGFETILQESGKRAVILLDDIDRLDRTEIHAIFKLVKLSASFEHTSYVLAFDDEMVAAALGEKYGIGGVTAGRSFLEKIIHVPLHLPPAATAELRKIALEGVEQALTQNQLDLTREEVKRFTRAFVDVFEPHLQTPRQAKRFANCISFALPLLRGDANLVDVMLIEATRVFFPKLYTAIRDNPDVFLASDHERGANANAEMKKRQDHLVNAALDDSGVSDKETIRRRLIDVLFPGSGRTECGDSWELQCSKEQRVCSKEYFARYFSYAVPSGDIGDVEVRQFVDDVRDGVISANEIRARLTLFSQRRAMPRLLTKLRYQEETIDPQAAQRIALAIAANGALFSKAEGVRVLGSTFMLGAILIRQLLKRVAARDRDKVALQVAQTAEPLPFAAECFHFIRCSKDESASEQILHPKTEALLGKTLATRIYDAAPVGDLCASFGTDTPNLLSVWKNMGLPGEMEAHLQHWLNESADSVDAFLAAFGGRVWEPGTGPSGNSEFCRDSYDRVAELIDPGVILERLRAAHGDRLEDWGNVEPQSQRDLKRKTARQFVAIHETALREKQQRLSPAIQREPGAAAEAMASDPSLAPSGTPTLFAQPWTPPTLRG